MRRRRTSHRAFRKTNTHIPTSIGNAPGINNAVLIIAVAPARDAGGAVSQDNEARDRDRLCSVGSNVNSIIFDVSMRQIEDEGILEYAIFKLERQLSAPVLGTAPIPTAGEMNGEGLQQALRRHIPGRVIKFGLVAFTAETTRAIKLRGDFKKFRLSSVRSGDYFCILLFNRSNAGTANTFDCQMRYKELI